MLFGKFSDRDAEHLLPVGLGALLVILRLHLERGMADPVAGVVGSAGYNATVTLGGAALARPLGTSGITGAAWLAAGLPLLILALGGRRGRLTPMTAVPLPLVCGIYILALYAWRAQ